MLILHIQLITRFRYVSFLGVKFMIFTKMLFPVSWSKWIKPVISVLWFTFPMFLILQAMGRTQLLLGLNTILLKMKSYAARTAQLCFIVHVTWDPIPKSIALANMYFACNAAAINLSLASDARRTYGMGSQQIPKRGVDCKNERKGWHVTCCHSKKAYSRCKGALASEVQEAVL